MEMMNREFRIVGILDSCRDIWGRPSRSKRRQVWIKEGKDTVRRYFCARDVLRSKNESRPQDFTWVPRKQGLGSGNTTDPNVQPPTITLPHWSWDMISTTRIRSNVSRGLSRNAPIGIMAERSSALTRSTLHSKARPLWVCDGPGHVISWTFVTGHQDADDRFSVQVFSVQYGNPAFGKHM